MKPRVFIGSSKERINIAHALGDNFNAAGTAEARVWSEGIMQLSKNTLDSLLSGLRKYDFAVFILGGDDITQIRDRSMASTRDNVIFELGLFIGHIGADRTFFVTPRSVSDLRIPTDLLGITYATYDDAPQDGNLRAALGPVFREIQQRIGDFPQTPLSGETRLYTIVGLLNKPPLENDDPCFQSFRYDYMHNQNPLANLWSDPRPGNCVTANICKGSQPSQFLRVNFRSSPSCYARAIGIHPEGWRARRISENYDHFRFTARLATVRKARDACATAIAMRLVDGDVRHWRYVKPTGEQMMFGLQPGWEEYRVQLRDEDRWHPFYGCGNYASQTKLRKLQVVASVIFEFGCDTGARELGPGRGIVEVCDLRLGSAE